MADMDVDDILAKQVEQLEKEKRELQEKLKSQEKKVSLLSWACCPGLVVLGLLSLWLCCCNGRVFMKNKWIK